MGKTGTVVKINVYFLLEREDESEEIDANLLKKFLETELNSHLVGESFVIKGSWFTGNRITAKHLLPEDVVKIIRTKP